jgi:hypothetical protein
MACKMKFKKLKIDKKFQPCSVDKDDEIFQNGFFHFNITKMIKFISQNKNLILVENIDVRAYRVSYSSNLNEETILTAQTSNPIILAEISPANYNVIDGNHRLEKSFRDGLEIIPGYKLTVDQHLKFLTSIEAYKAYVRYWNEKVSALGGY